MQLSILTPGAAFTGHFMTLIVRCSGTKLGRKASVHFVMTHANTNPVWPTHHACSQPFHRSISSHGQLFRPFGPHHHGLTLEGVLKHPPGMLALPC